MTLQQASIILQRLAIRFNTTVPGLGYNKGQRCWYYPNEQLITLRPTAEEHCLLHEFAHHYNTIYRGGRHHDRGFWHALHDVCNFYYDGNISRYPWATEYRIGVRYANKHGFLPKTTKTHKTKNTTIV